MNRIILALLLLVSVHANAALLCTNFDTSETIVWRVGDNRAALDGFNTAYGDDIVCRAWGRELELIQQEITGVRGRRGSGLGGYGLIEWQGDDAVFIIQNL